MELLWIKRLSLFTTSPRFTVGTGTTAISIVSMETFSRWYQFR